MTSTPLTTLMTYGFYWEYAKMKLTCGQYKDGDKTKLLQPQNGKTG